MLYQIRGGSVSLGGELVLNHVNFEIKHHEKIAVVGPNGAGKTTLLRLIAAELSPDRDDSLSRPPVWMAEQVTVGFLPQHPFPDEQIRVREIMDSLFGHLDKNSREYYEQKMEFDRILTGFGFCKEDAVRKTADFSGGERTRIAMIRLLLQRPDILLLDEPTNHLDLASVNWLEDYVRNYPKAVILVSHDRYFLDETVEIVYELQDGVLTRYAGNYSAYRVQKRKRLDQWRKRYQAQQQEIQKNLELIERFRHKPRKASLARNRKKMLDKMVRIDPPPMEYSHVFTGKIDPAVRGSRQVLETDRLKIGYDRVLAEISLAVRRGRKIGILGPNGIGKSTFLRTISGMIPALGGSFRLGASVRIGFFDQFSGRFSDQDKEKRVFEYMQKHFPGKDGKEIREILAAYLFRGDQVSLRLSDLSGGEGCRLVLAAMLEDRPNLLLLDEPTNHMDIPARETLESAFQSYTGTILFISHDRYFIREIADSLLIFQEEGVTYYPFGYDHYRERERRRRDASYEGLSPVQVENTLLVEGLKAVPDKERHQTSRYSTDQSFTEWQLDLAREAMEEAGSAVAEIEEALLFPDSLAAWKAYREADRQVLYDRWTRTCLEWYEKWLDWKEAFAGYQ